MFDPLSLVTSLFLGAAPAAPPTAFPPGFVWGTATAAIQVEGGTPFSDWAAFEARPGAIRGGQRIGEAARHYELFEQDFAAAAAMNTDGYRFSVEWSRLEPLPGRWNRRAAAHYRAMLRSLRAKGIRPMVTLHHFSNPQWVADQGGWLAPKTAEDFGAFAGRAGAAFGDLADDWVTINEPTLYAAESHFRGVFPPGRQGGLAELPRVLANLARGHARAYQALKRADRVPADPRGPAARVGVAEHMAAIHPALPWNPLDIAVAAVSESWFNFSFLDACATGRLRFEAGVSRVHEDLPELARTLDFVGVNYYTRALAHADRPLDRRVSGDLPRSDLGLEIYPDGMYEVLMRTHARYRLPAYVTETGVSDASRDLTPAFMVRHLARIARARRDGADVRGVYWWSLLDNFEWQNGYTGGRFGLLAVDFEHPARPRAWTPAARTYQRIAGANRLPEEVLAAYGDASCGVRGPWTTTGGRRKL